MQIVSVWGFWYILRPCNVWIWLYSVPNILTLWFIERCKGRWTSLCEQRWSGPLRQDPKQILRAQIWNSELLASTILFESIRLFCHFGHNTCVVWRWTGTLRLDCYFWRTHIWLGKRLHRGALFLGILQPRRRPGWWDSCWCALSKLRDLLVIISCG